MTADSTLNTDAMDSPAEYSRTAKIFHWVTAAAFLVQFPLGYTMAQLTAGPKAQFFTSLHQGIGFFILWLVVLRLFYRLRNRVKRRNMRLANWHAMATRAAHAAIYTLLVLVPLTGWLGASAMNGLELFGVFSLPSILSPDDARAVWLFWTHGLMAFGLMALVAVHIGFAMQGYLESSSAPEDSAARPAI